MSAGKNVRPIEGGTRYRFPTHTAELIFDRKDADRCEVFVVILEPGEATPVHAHDDMDQLYYVIEGTGILSLGEAGEDRTQINPGNLVHVPVNTHHSISNTDEAPLRYLAVDIFTHRNPEEPTWDSHIRNVCETMGWDYEKVRQAERV